MSTDILLVNLPPHESYYADKVPHLGMLYVMTSLSEHGYTVGYLDCAERGVRRDQIIGKIREAAPRMVGFSIDTDNLFSAGNMSRTLKREFGDDLKIIFGGPASQGQPDEIMRRSAADVLVIGEGEYTAREVADSLLRGAGPLGEVEGICYRDGDGLVYTKARQPIDDLDALPFPDYRFLANPLDYKPAIISGRGCPFKCTFCFEGRMGNRYRHRSPENIVAEIEKLVELYGPVYISINDDTFTSNPKHALQVCDLLKKRFRPRKDLLWFAEVRVDVVRRYPELVDAMVESGAGRIQIGVESGDEEILRAYKRLNVKPHVVEDVVGRFHRAGLPSIYCGFIAGGPGETPQTLETTLTFAKRLATEIAPGSFECFASFLTPLAGTEIREHPDRFDVRILDPDLLTSSNFNFPVTETATLSRADINNFRWRFIEEVDQAICSTIPKLPRGALVTHADINRRFGVTTAYFDRFDRFPRLRDYLKMVGAGGLEAGDELSDDDLLARYPTRITAQTHMREETLSVLGGPTSLTLNGLGARVYALCSGKLSGAEIVEHLTRELEGTGVSQAAITKDVVEFLRDLDNNYAVMFKDF